MREYSAVAAVMEEEGIAIGDDSDEKKNISRGEIFFKGENGDEEKFLSPR